MTIPLFRRHICWLLALVVIIVFPCTKGMTGGNNVHQEQVVWHIDNLTTIGGETITILGEPRVVAPSGDSFIEFDGIDDGIQVDNHPLEGAGEFTIEIIFRPDAGGLTEQRFLHLQEGDSENRLLIETRLTDNNEWYLDTYMRSDDTSQALIDSSHLHPVGEWFAAALVFDGTEMRHYVNDIIELSAEIAHFSPPHAGKTSIGVRMNRVCWFKGAVKLVRFTRRALAPAELLAS